MKAPALSVNRILFTELLYHSLSPAKVKLKQKANPLQFDKEELVIVAEGSQSPTRKAIYPQLTMRNSHQLIWRGIAKLILPAAFHNTYYDYIGGNLRFGLIHSGGNMYNWYAVEEISKSL